MDVQLISIINLLIEKGILADTSLILIVISMLVLGYKYILKPIHFKMKDVPTKEDLGEVLDQKFKTESLNLDELSKKLEKLTELLDAIEDIERDSYRELEALKHDIEQIKQILNQFHGHLIYSGRRRDSDFGNRELKWNT